MTYIIFGLLLFIFGAYFLRKSMKEQDKEGVIGFTAILIAAMLMILFFGLFFRYAF